MRRFASVALAIMAVASQFPAHARQPEAPEQEQPEKPLTDDTVTVGDVATTPLSDLNLSKDEIPAILTKALDNPYDRTGIQGCAQIISAVRVLDAILGDDLDITNPDKRGVNAGRVAQWAVGSFIPFRGLIREISGAKAHERSMRDAITAGMMRRAWLKGIGQQKGCRYPGRPARTSEVATIQAHLAAQREAAKKAGKESD